MFFERAINNAKQSDAPAIAQVIMLATNRPEGTDEVMQAADQLYLQWLIADEIMSGKKVRSLKNIIGCNRRGGISCWSHSP